VTWDGLLNPLKALGNIWLRGEVAYIGALLGNLSYRRGLQTWFTDASVSSKYCKGCLAACMAAQGSSEDLGGSLDFTKGTWQHLATWGGRIEAILGSLSYGRGLRTWFTDTSVTS